MTDIKPTLKSVTDKAIKHALLNVDPKDEVGRMHAVKRIHKAAPGLLSIRCYLHGLKEDEK